MPRFRVSDEDPYKEYTTNNYSLDDEDTSRSCIEHMMTVMIIVT